MREGLGLSTEYLAERAGTSKATISRLETGRRTVSADLLARIARVLAEETEARRSA